MTDEFERDQTGHDNSVEAQPPLAGPAGDPRAARRDP